MERVEKENVVAKFKKEFSSAAAVMVVDYRGLTVDQVNTLRASFRKVGVKYHVVKNTLARLAIVGTPFEGIAAWLKGTTAIAMTNEDAPNMAKAALDFAKTNDKFKLRGAFVEGQEFAGAAVKQLSELPTKAEARAQLLGVINAPFAKLLAQMNAPAQQLVGVLQAKVEKDEKPAA